MEITIDIVLEAREIPFRVVVDEIKIAEKQVEFWAGGKLLFSKKVNGLLIPAGGK